jgi:hypothetical protein
MKEQAETVCHNYIRLITTCIGMHTLSVINFAEQWGNNYVCVVSQQQHCI